MQSVTKMIVFGTSVVLSCRYAERGITGRNFVRSSVRLPYTFIMKKTAKFSVCIMIPLKIKVLVF